MKGGENQAEINGALFRAQMETEPPAPLPQAPPLSPVDVCTVARDFSSTVSEILDDVVERVRVYLQYSIERDRCVFMLASKSEGSLHNLDHVLRVAAWGCYFLKQLGIEDNDIKISVIWAAIFHDSVREDDSVNSHHGAMGANEWNLFTRWIEGKKEECERLMPKKEYWHNIETAIRKHVGSCYSSYGDRELDRKQPLITRVLCDSDRIDRYRFRHPSLSFFYLLNTDKPYLCPARRLCMTTSGDDAKYEYIKNNVILRFGSESPEVKKIMSLPEWGKKIQ